MNWNQLLCEQRQCPSKKRNTDERNEFQRDYHRIVGSASFRRLQDKTQVFPLDKSDFVRTRLTHSIEVSSFAKSLGQTCFLWLKNNAPDRPDLPTDAQIGEIANILECAGLIHDIGNPPFGHFGETSVRNWFSENMSSLRCGAVPVELMLTDRMKNDLLFFEGNAQALRLLTKLHYLVDDKGMHLTYALLNTIIKYPVDSCSINKSSGNIKDKKLGYYLAEEELFRQITDATGAHGMRYPLVYLLEAADDIAYSTADIEDAVKKGFLSYENLLEELKSERYLSRIESDNERRAYNAAVEKLSAKYENAKLRGVSDPKLNAVQNWIIYMQNIFINSARFGFTSNYGDIMNGSFTREIIQSPGCQADTLMFALKDIATRYVFQSSHIIKMEISANTIINFLLSTFIPAAVKYDTDEKLSSVEERLISVISRNYLMAYNTAAQGKNDCERLYLRLLLVTDYICGMTDSYAKNLYQQLNGIY